MRDRLFPLPPQHVLEMLYHRELGYGLGDGDNTVWSFASALTEMNIDATDAEIDRYRAYFIERGWGRFDGKVDPGFRISATGEEAARISIARRKPIHSWERIRTYDWAFVGAMAAIFAAISSVITVLQATNAQAH